MHRVALLASLLAGCVFHVNTYTDHDSLAFPEPVDAVSFDLAAGNLTVEVADVTEVQVDRAWSWTGDRPHVVARVEGGTLVLEVDCTDNPLRQCSVDHTVLVPASVALVGDTGAGDVTGFDLLSADVTTGAGNVTLLGVAGDVFLDSGSGDAKLEDVTGDVQAHVGSGDVTGDGLAASDLWVDSGSGDVDLELIVAPVNADVSTGSGDVSLALPAGVYDLTTHTGSGDVTVSGIDVAPGAASRLDLETGSGDILVVGR